MDGRTDTAAGTPARGLYRPETEHDACGVGFVAHLGGARSHAVLADALRVLARLEHRGGRLPAVIRLWSHGTPTRRRHFTSGASGRDLPSSWDHRVVNGGGVR